MAAVVELKFCGLTREADAAHAASAGAQYVGEIFAGGPRELTPERAAQVLDAAGPSVRRVGVFGADFRARVAATAATARLDAIQLHGDPTTNDIADARKVFAGEVWAVVRITGAGIPDNIGALQSSADAVLFDPRVSGKLGGTGVRLEWHALGPLLDQSRMQGGRIVLAGGLTPENVAEAIAAVRPSVVDVSSGVESAPGVKDHGRMTAFAEAVRRSSR